MYGNSNYYTDVNKLHYDMLSQKSKTMKGPTLSSAGGVDLSLLLYLANYQSYIWNMPNTAFTNIPNPVNKGCKIDECGETGR